MLVVNKDKIQIRYRFQKGWFDC